MGLDQEFIQAIKNDTLILHYQPKASLQDGRVSSVEALLRWPHKKFGMLSPSDFIPIIESTPAIEPFTKWLVDTALAQLRAWNQADLDLGLSINYSVRNMDRDFRMVHHLIDKVSAYNLDPAKIDVEITETLPSTDLSKVAAGAALLQSKGISVSLDDFCTRFSSLECILEIPTNILKIDKVFVDGSLSDSKALGVIKALIVMAQELGMDVVAEGIETAEQYRMLKRLNCTYGQGFYIAKPMAGEAIPLWMAQHQEKLDLGMDPTTNFI